MNQYYYIPIRSQYLLNKIPIGSKIDGLVWAYPCGYAPFRIGILFVKDPRFRALVGLRDAFDDLCWKDIYL